MVPGKSCCPFKVPPTCSGETQNHPHGALAIYFAKNNEVSTANVLDHFRRRIRNAVVWGGHQALPGSNPWPEGGPGRAQHHGQSRAAALSLGSVSRWSAAHTWGAGCAQCPFHILPLQKHLLLLPDFTAGVEGSRRPREFRAPAPLRTPQTSRME